MIKAEDYLKHMQSFEDHISRKCTERVDSYIEERIRAEMAATTIQDSLKSRIISYQIPISVDSPFMGESWKDIHTEDRRSAIIASTLKYVSAGWAVTRSDGNSWTLSCKPTGCKISE